MTAPDRIRVAQDADGFWTCRESVSGSQEYVRADLYAALEAQLAEKDKEIAALRAERDFLQEVLDTRPAINAALPESYIRWSQSLYSGEAARASLEARNVGGKDAE